MGLGVGVVGEEGEADYLEVVIDDGVIEISLGAQFFKILVLNSEDLVFVPTAEGKLARLLSQPLIEGVLQLQLLPPLNYFLLLLFSISLEQLVLPPRGHAVHLNVADLGVEPFHVEGLADFLEEAEVGVGGGGDVGERRVIRISRHPEGGGAGEGVVGGRGVEGGDRVIEGAGGGEDVVEEFVHDGGWY